MAAAIWQEPLTQSERSIIERHLADPKVDPEELKKWLRFVLKVYCDEA